MAKSKGKRRHKRNLVSREERQRRKKVRSGYGFIWAALAASMYMVIILIIANDTNPLTTTALEDCQVESGTLEYIETRWSGGRHARYITMLKLHEHYYEFKVTPKINESDLALWPEEGEQLEIHYIQTDNGRYCMEVASSTEVLISFEDTLEYFTDNENEFKLISKIFVIVTALLYLIGAIILYRNRKKG